MKQINIILLLVLGITTLSIQQAKAVDIYADYSDSSFEQIFSVDRLESIEMWEQPKTQYTPKNLRKEQQMRFSGHTGNTLESYTLHLTDYDTYIVQGGKYTDGNYYVQDNTGKLFLTGHDYSSEIQTVADSVINNTNEIQNINNSISGLNQGYQSLNNRMDRLDAKIESGLATVTALTSLHPNPRATEKLELSIGAGMYADNTAGALGLFYHPNNRVQVMVGASYGGDSQFAGAVGVTFSIGGKRK